MCVGERRVDVTLTQHPTHYIRVLSFGDQEGRQTVAKVVKSESGFILPDNPEFDRNGPDVIGHHRSGRPWLLASQLE